MSYETLLLESKDRVLLITIHRPQVLNALNSQTLQELEAAFEEAAARDDIRAAVLTGAGDKAFVAGADISEMQAMSPEQIMAYSDRGLRLTLAMQAVPKPIIAAVNGYAFGGGLELAMACDFIFAAETAKLGQPEINLGITPGFGGTQRLARIVGRPRALEMLLTGDPVTAAEARDMGLVNRVLPREGLLATALATAAKMATRGAFALAQIKRAVYQGEAMPLPAALAYENQLFSLCFTTADQKEGMRAFLEKRKPSFG